MHIGRVWFDVLDGAEPTDVTETPRVHRCIRDQERAHQVVTELVGRIGTPWRTPCDTGLRRVRW